MPLSEIHTRGVHTTKHNTEQTTTANKKNPERKNPAADLSTLDPRFGPMPGRGQTPGTPIRQVANTNNNNNLSNVCYMMLKWKNCWYVLYATHPVPLCLCTLLLWLMLVRNIEMCSFMLFHMQMTYGNVACVLHIRLSKALGNSNKNRDALNKYTRPANKQELYELVCLFVK